MVPGSVGRRGVPSSRIVDPCTGSARRTTLAGRPSVCELGSSLHWSASGSQDVYIFAEVYSCLHTPDKIKSRNQQPRIQRKSLAPALKALALLDIDQPFPFTVSAKCYDIQTERLLGDPHNTAVSPASRAYQPTVFYCQYFITRGRIMQDLFVFL